MLPHSACRFRQGVTFQACELNSSDSGSVDLRCAIGLCCKREDQVEEAPALSAKRPDWVNAAKVAAPNLGRGRGQITAQGGGGD
jgi:hypothetical protein